MKDYHFFDRLQDHFNQHLPFVAYRKPNKSEVNAILQPNNTLYKTADFKERGFVFSPFENLRETLLIPFENSEILETSLDISSSVSASNVNKSVNHAARDYHIKLVEKAIEVIKNKGLEKVVLSRQEEVDIKDSNPITIFKNLLNVYQSAFVYCWYHPKVGLWLGATPETLIKIEGRQFSIMALAGTQDYNESLDVIWQEKEKHEQQVVTDFIIDNLKPFVNKLNVSDTETVKAGNLLHLKTIITAFLKPQANLNELISLLHPTPAVCGLPKDKAKQFILANENYKREFYTGFLGELNLETTKGSRSIKRNIENRAYAITRKSTQLYVNLRCMQIKDQQALIYVGGGVTEASIPDKEWEETVSKSLVIKSVLN